MINSIQQVGQFFLDVAGKSIRQGWGAHGDDEHWEGFTRAADIALRRIQVKIDAFMEKMDGSGLTKAEQACYLQLIALKSEIEADYDRYWLDTGVDWRPPKPIAKGTIRPTGESQSEN